MGYDKVGVFGDGGIDVCYWVFDIVFELMQGVVVVGQVVGICVGM